MISERQRELRRQRHRRTKRLKQRKHEAIRAAKKRRNLATPKPVAEPAPAEPVEQPSS